MAINTPQKFSKEELNQIEKLQSDISAITARFGSLKISKIRLENEENSLKSKLSNLFKQEKELAK
jgi:predicted nuclease with TOPRIM domain